MGGYHALMHLVKDQLVDPCEPRTINSAIASTGVDTYLPIGRSVDHDHGEVPSTSTTTSNTGSPNMLAQFQLPQV